MWKNICKAILFLTIFALLFLLISPVFIPKNNSGEAGIHDAHAKGFLGEGENTLDVVFLGDSEAYSAFIPLRLWEKHGIPSYVCSVGDQMMYQSYAYLQRVFQYHSPKIVVLETNALYREFTLMDMLSHETEERLLFLRYHDRWKQLHGEDWTESVEFTDTVRDRGYAYHTEVVAAATEGYMAPSDEAQPVPYLNGEYARKIQNLCREKGAVLILVSTPSPTNWSMYYHNGVTQLAQTLDAEYLDLNLMPQEVPIDWNTDSYDGGDHLNYSGACKVTDYMGQLLWGSGLFTDKREQAEYASWNADLAEFLAEVAAEKAK